MTRRKKSGFLKTGLVTNGNGFIEIAGIRFTTSTFLSDESTYSHEIANLAGLEDANDDETWSIGSRRSTNVEPDHRDIFAGTAYYDAMR